MKSEDLNRQRVFQISNCRDLILVGCLSLFLAGFLSPAQAEPTSQSGLQRILSGSPSITEILFALGVGDRVVGVTTHCDYPPEALERSKIGSLLGPFLETWITLSPDLLIYPDNHGQYQVAADTLSLKRLPLRLKTIDDILAAIRLLGKTLNLPDNGETLAGRLEDKMEEIRQRRAGAPEQPVLMLLGVSADPHRKLSAAGYNTFLNDVLELAGGKNILPPGPVHYPVVSREIILQASPETILVLGPPSELTPERIEAYDKTLGRLQTVAAVKNNRIFYISAEYILIPGPRMLQIADKLAEILSLKERPGGNVKALTHLPPSFPETNTP